jgi:hypothetical protein
MIEYIEPVLIAGRFDRQLRLFMCAVAARVAGVDPTGSASRLIRLAERFADGDCDYPQMSDEERRGDRPYQSGDRSPAASAYMAARMLPFDPADRTHKFDTAYFAITFAWGAVDSEEAEDRVQAGLMKDVFGNPFRPVKFDPEWRTSAAVQLAAGMYEARDFALMPILADALEDAGCDSNDILAHCRDPHAAHVRGCWVVDLVLGKG